ncbi:SusD/RagB family nutrient-binding outer membrane lipoprotein [Sediminibacterium roseum]|uniref:SusD/RagB family nutrient-binding outer membrane lipoprotein n=1 Tax=Sediminibacterium roseum TaxID=1978412 RepID=A0ABW9ZXL5_9BACT|nr:SusD/RagB family nutrient-binding outer membrane lipoprotein [Sediminibacterium roseum]NCI50442.1 SusD/RagB family nutrient-binding outer membrane lipoprotein [Sediminibacterium roseum]
MKFIKYLFISAIILSSASCKKWMDINTSPANPQEVNPEILLPPMQYQMANGTASDYGGYLFKYIQYCSNQNADAIWEKHGYEAATDFSGVMWRMTYVNLGPNLEEMIKKSVTQQKYIYAGIGMAMKAWSFQILTDYHGPIILDEAYDQTKLHFTYQEQDKVYEKVREWSYEALAFLNRTDGKDDPNMLKGVTGDQIYKGDVSKWKKFVYGLLAQQYSHLVNKADFKTKYADSVIKFTDLSFANESEDPMVFFNGTIAADANPMGVLNSGNILNYNATTARVTGRISTPILKALTGGLRGTALVDVTAASPTYDPRLTRMLTACPDGVFRGVIPTYGDPATTKRIPHILGSVSAPYPGKYIFADKALYPLMSYSQMQFIRAEALLIKGGREAEAYQAYINGIDGHMDFINRYGLNGGSSGMTITPAQIAAYKAGTEVAPNAASLTIADIMGQKFIAQWGWAGVEQWCDLRKYDYSAAIFKTYYQLTGSEIYSVNNGNYVHRVRPRYNSEYVWNKDELAKWGGLNNDYHTQKMWFSKP